jgi:GH24 family phage-related lysozyme (muramidase)
MHPLNEYEVVDYKPAENNSEFLGRENFGDVYEFEVSGLEYIARVYYNRNHSPGTKEIDFRLKETDSYSNRVNKGPGHLFSVVHTVLKIVDDVAKKDKVKRFLITGEGDNKDYGKEKTSRADVYERIIKRIYPEEAISVYKNKILIDMTKVYPDIIKDDEMDRIIKMLTHNLLKISDENPDPYSISAGIDGSHSDSVLEGKFPVQILNSKFGKIELEFYVDLEEAFCELEWRFENGESGNKEFNNADEMALFLERKFSPDSLDEINNPLNELEQYLNEAFGSINESDEPSPTFEWDIAKEKIDKSKKGINTAEKAYEYLNWFLDKVKSLPKSIKLKLTKYTVMSLMVLLGAGAINGIVSDKAPEISQSIAIAISVPEEVPEIEVAPEKEVYSKPTEVSGSLISFLKDEEGSAEQKGEPVLTAYDNLGDGMVTIGYGHAERIESTELIPDVTTITRERADELLAEDIEDAKAGLDRLLGRWDEAGIEYNIDQGMYNAMTSMIFNMGIGNFLTSDFIQLVKSGDYEEAADKILTTNVSYLGHIPRRKEEKEMFTSGNNTQAQQIAMNEARKIVRQVLSESVIEETQAGQKDLEKFVNDIMLFLGKRIVKEYEHNALLDPLSPHLRFLPELRTGTMTGEGFEEMGEFVKNTSIKVIPTTTIGGNPETKGMLSYGRPIQNSGKEVFEIRLKYEDEKLDEINQMFAEKPLGEVSYKDVYFKIFYMFNSVLLHEVQHAYDAWRSKGKALDSADNKGFVDRSRKAKALARSKKYDDLTPEEIKAINDSYAEYQNLVHEINARYAQTMNKVRMTSLDDDWNHVEKPWKSVYSDFKTHFDGWSRLSDKMKKKLTRRLAKAFQESSDRISADTAKANEKEPKSVMSENLKGDDCNSFFDINSLDRYVEFEKPLYSMIAKRKTAKLVYISPKQYIYKIAHGFGGLSYDDVVDSGAVVKSNIDKYADAMLAGDKFPIGHYTKDGENQEGRHRALAAMKIGCEKIPVIQFMKISDKEFLNTVNRLKGMSFDELDGLFKKIGFKNGITQLGYNDLKRYVDYNLQENNAKLDRVRGMVRRVLKESVIEEIIEGEFNAYHGSPTKINKFTDDFVGGEKANDAQGAGIYFATNPEDASYYGDHIYKVIIKGNFLDRNAPIENVDVEELVKLIKMKDEWEMNAQDYSPDPEAGAYEAAYRTIEYNGDEAEAFQQIEADFYRYDSVDYVRNMTKLGYDGIIVDAPSGFVGDKHIIVFNPDAVTLTGKL